MRKLIVAVVLTLVACSPAKLFADVELDTTIGGWTPTHFSPTFIPNESVSLLDEWPRHGDKVEVLCQEEGGEVLDMRSNELDRTWIKVVVPADRLDPKAATRVERMDDGRIVAYMPRWPLKLPDDIPVCKR